MIKDANEMKKQATQTEAYKIGYERAINSVMKRIEQASEKGYRSCGFSVPCYCYKTEDSDLEKRLYFYDEVREEFSKHGYTFKPTGYIGGVWQNTEDICW